MAPESVEDEIAALRAAAAKAREDAAKLAKDIGKELPADEIASPSSSTTTGPPPPPPAKKSASEILSLTSAIDFTSGSASLQSQSLDDLLSSNTISLWKNAITTNAARPYPVSLDFLERRSDGKLTADGLGVGGEPDVSLDDFKYGTLYVVGTCSVLGVGSLAFLPPNIGATLCYFFALIPILFIGIGSTSPGIIAGGLAALKGTKDDKDQRDDRVCRHEAAHFLCGYLCGLPIKNYRITDDGFPCVEFHSSAEDDGATSRRELSQEEIAALSVVAMSGSVAEAIAFGKARGGENDLLELNAAFRRCEEFMGAQKQQDLTRWGALAAYQLLKGNEGAYEGLVKAFREKKSVAECVAVIESS